jgi:hypothetical protein
VIRTIWLGFTFLIILAGAGSFRFAFGHFDIANASGIVLPEQSRTIGSKVVQDTLTRADQLPVASVTPAPDAAELAKAAYSAVEVLHGPLLAVNTPDVVERTPDVVEQQAQEPPPPPVVRPAPSVVRKAKVEKPKRKQPKLDAVAAKAPPATDVKICQLEEFEAFRYAFSLPTGCHKAAVAISNQLVSEPGT